MANDKKVVDGVEVELSDEEQAQLVADKKTWDDAQAIYVANHKYKDDRVEAYALIGDQLDQLFHDMTNEKGDKSGEWYKAVAKVKSDFPKPE